MTSSLPYNYIYRIIFVGDPYVGKTALASTLTSNSMPLIYNTTIGIDFFSSLTLLNDVIIKSHIWDTAGQEYYLSIVESYFRDIIAAFIIYDVSDRKTFQNVPRWLKRINNANVTKKFIILIGNKTDLERKVSKEEGKNYAKENDLLFFEMSKRDQTNNINIFNDVIEHIYTKMGDEPHPGIKKYEGYNSHHLVKHVSTTSSRDCCFIS